MHPSIHKHTNGRGMPHQTRAPIHPYIHTYITAMYTGIQPYVQAHRPPYWQRERHAGRPAYINRGRPTCLHPYIHTEKETGEEPDIL